jgi:hypothetical protein
MVSENNYGVRREVRHFEIPADNVDGLRAFILHYLDGNSNKVKHKPTI